MFRAPRLVLGATEGVISHFHIFHSQTCFRRYRWNQVSFSCFALPDLFWAVPMALGLVFMFCAPEPVLGGTDGVRSRFHVLRSRTRFGRYRWHQVPFSCFALPDSFSVVPRASTSIFMFHTPDSFLAVPRSSGPVFMFYAPGIVFGGTEGVEFRFNVWRFHVGFRRYRGRRVLFSYFAILDSFGAVPWVSGPVLMFCTLRLVLGATEGVISLFIFFAPGLIFGVNEGTRYHFHVLRSRTSFGRYRWRSVSFSCFALHNPFWAVPMAPVSFSFFALPNPFWVVARSPDSI
jgi:hypothetical protein